MADSRLPSPSVCDKNTFQLPSQYKFLKVLGEGGFGKVLKCLKRDTEDIVAIKIPKDLHDASKEIAVLKNIMLCNLDQSNIVKFFDWFQMGYGKVLVFEMLDISIEKFIFTKQRAPILLSDIRVIIQQVATALDALKSIRVIHTDIKPDNIMLVDHQIRPLRVKLIDFGLAMPISKARKDMLLQTVSFRSPEIILGLPFSEAIDMWSVGCVMASMIFSLGSWRPFLLFPTLSEFQAMQFMVEVLGQPADHLLNEGRKTPSYFTRTEPNGWRLKTPQEYWGIIFPMDSRTYKYRSLDDLSKERLLWTGDKAKPSKLYRNCMELLKAMLKMDEAERITPSEVLTHPFIAEERHNSHNEASKSAAAEPPRSQAQTRSEEPMELDWTCFDDRAEASAILGEHCDPPAPALKDIDTTYIHPDHHGPSPTVPRSTVIMVRPAAAHNRMDLEDEERATSVLTGVNNTSRSEASACPSEHTDCDPPAPVLKDVDNNTNIHPDHHSPSRTILPSGLIMVRPAAANNRMDLEDQESATSLQAGLNEMSERSLKVVERDTTAWIPENSTTSDDTRTTKKKEKKQKKKKNCFRRVFSWMKKNLCSCWTCVEEDE